ncbi:MAG: lytic transglycosylase domain-containing protein [Candidatus Eremiobacteraeota bacterium]|nr:lytic transglycosylase domain-containing protein [Candidatus Eremiobacteraeota bacterium]MBV8375359.1 lytic transglycosylase domain-containing protein [Candidatus Eremiobacteraeota bacterium]
MTNIGSELAAIARRIAEISALAGAPAPKRFENFVAERAERLATPIDRLVSKAGSAWKVDPALIKAVIADESGFSVHATSHAGAQGLMQLMPTTAARLGVTDAYDPEQNVWAGTRYLRELLDRFGGDVGKAVAAYNAGPAAVEKYGGIPPYTETQNYVKNVLAGYAKYKAQFPR